MQSKALFGSRGFKLRKWITSRHAESILSRVPKCELAPCIREIDLGSGSMPDFKALGLIRDPECDQLRIPCDKNFCQAATKREAASQLASQFDPLGMVSPYLLKGKLTLQKIAALGINWDESLPNDIQSEWACWIESLSAVSDLAISRHCFKDSEDLESTDKVIYQLHGFCDASNSAISCVIYLRRLVNDQPKTALFLEGPYSFQVMKRTGLLPVKNCRQLH